MLKVTFPSGAKANLGNVLQTSQVQGVPHVTWDAEEGYYYTLVFYNPDAPSRDNFFAREVRLWLVFNIPGNKVDEGDLVEEYVPACKPMNAFYRLIIDLKLLFSLIIIAQYLRRKAFVALPFLSFVNPTELLTLMNHTYHSVHTLESCEYLAHFQFFDLFLQIKF